MSNNNQDKQIEELRGAQNYAGQGSADLSQDVTAENEDEDEKKDE